MSGKITAWSVSFALSVFVTLASASAAEVSDLSLEQTDSLVQSGQVVLVDVRRTDEWRKTGVPTGALEVSWEEDGGKTTFANRLKTALGSSGVESDQTIVLICAGGVRSKWAGDYLLSQGFTDVAHVPRGVEGPFFGTGWREEGYPMEPCKSCAD